MSRSRSLAAEVPHSWDIEHWPDHVYPGSPSRARYLIRSHKDDLIRAGALARVGRELVIFGSRFARWLETHASDVPGYQAAANRGRPREVAA